MNSNDEHKKTDEDQPWNQTFSEDRDENGNLSRVKLRKESQNHHLITIILAALIIIVALVALAYGLIRQSAMGQADSSKSASSVRVVRQDNAKKKSSSAHSDVKKENAKQSSVNKAKTAERSKREQRRASAAESSPTTKAKASTSSSITAASSESTAQKPAGTSAAKRTTATQKSVSGSRYATVEPGQGLYRVAVNHGISLAELMRLNGLSTTSSIHPGQQLRVR